MLMKSCFTQQTKTIVFCSGADMAQRKGTAKLTELLAIEEEMQKRWAEDRAFELDAPDPGSEDAKYVLKHNSVLL